MIQSTHNTWGHAGPGLVQKHLTSDIVPPLLKLTSGENRNALSN